MDLILFNATIMTMDEIPQSVSTKATRTVAKDASLATAVAIKNGIIQKLGTNEEILSLKENHTKLVNLENKLLLPGFNDSHMHLLGYAYTSEKIDLTEAESFDAVIDISKTFIKENHIALDSWILGRGWCQNNWSNKDMPSRYDLDKISTTNPIVLVRVCGHIAVVNSKALEVLNLLDTVPILEGAEIDTDSKGTATGIFRENALTLIYDAMPVPTVQDIKRMLEKASKDALSKGITSIQTDDFESIPGRDYQKIIQAYEELVSEGRLSVRINEQCLLPEVKRLKEFIAAGYHTGYGNDFFKIGPLKLLTDGSLGARTALLSSPYADAAGVYGISVFTQQQLDELVETAYKNGMQVAVHCIGDKAMYMTFESYEKVLCKDWNIVSHNTSHTNQHDSLQSKLQLDPRFSIIHCQITDEVLLKKYIELNIIAHIQPIFIQSDLHMVDSRIGTERAENSYCWKTMYQTGVHVAHGSDCPVEKFDVLPGIYCAVTRKDQKGFPEGGWYSEQCLSVYDAVKGFTLGAAYASFEEDKKGSITEGKFADLVVLNQNIFEIDKNLIKDINVDMTIIDGKIKYERSIMI